MTGGAGDVERVKTHVEGLDDLIGGGIPKGHVVLVSGLPGTMKSSLTYSILYRNGRARSGQGVYVSLEQTMASLAQQMRGMGFTDHGGVPPVGIVDVAGLRADFANGEPMFWLDFLRRALETRKRVGGLDLLVIDSLEALQVLTKFPDPRADLFRLFGWLRELGVTAFVITETPPEPVLLAWEPSPLGDASYLADGVIHLKMHQVSDVAVQRRIRVVKMRGTKHETGYFALVYEDGAFGVTPALSV